MQKSSGAYNVWWRWTHKTRDTYGNGWMLSPGSPAKDHAAALKEKLKLAAAPSSVRKYKPIFQIRPVGLPAPESRDWGDDTE